VAIYAQAHAHDCMAAFKAGLGQEYALVLGTVALMEDVDAPTKEYQKAVQKLRGIGIEITLEKLLGKTLAHRAASKRYSGKTQKKRASSDIRPDVSTDIRSDVRSDAAPPLSISINPSPAEKEVARKTRKPRQPSKGKLALAEFNSAVTQVTGSPSCVTGMANETRAATFAEAVSAAGETMVDAVKRRHGLGKSLTLHWMMNDYAGDRVAKRPVNTGNHLRQPHPREIPTDPEAARVYWLGEQKDEPRFDFG
jgi:hypothetical protein